MVVGFREKRGWVRIMEAVIAILLLSGVLAYITVKNEAAERADELSVRVADAHARILSDIAANQSLRAAVIEENTSILEGFINYNLEAYFNFSFGICALDSSICPPKHPYSVIETSNDIFVEERIISSTLQEYNPQIFRLYIWKK